MAEAVSLSNEGEGVYMNLQPKSRRPSWLTRELFPFESRFVDIEGNQVHYVDEGSGSKMLLFLHGNPDWSFVYRDLISALKNEYRCVALDYPGWGLSVAAANYGLTPPEHASIVKAFVRKLDLKDVILFGHDWAGPIGLHVAEALPERFTGLIMGNTWAWSIVGNATDERFSKIMGSGFARFLNRHTNFFPRIVWSQGFKRSKLEGDARMAHFKPFEKRSSRLGPIVMAGQILGASEFLNTVESDVHRIAKLPTLITWSTADFAFGDAHRERLEGMFDNPSRTSIEGAGHCIAEDAPDELLSAIRKWLRTTF